MGAEPARPRPDAAGQAEKTKHGCVIPSCNAASGPTRAMSSLLTLQRSAGNAAVAAMVQRSTSTLRGTIRPLPGGSGTRPLPQPSGPAAVEPAVPASVEQTVGSLGTGLLRTALTSGAPATAPALGGLDGGQQLPREVRAPFERSFGYDLSPVRLHSGAAARRVTVEADAAAFSVGDHVVLGSGLDLSSAGGRHILGHELAHTVQSRLGGGRGGQISRPWWPAEQEAERAAAASVASRPYELTEGADDDLNRIAPWLILAGIGLAAGLVTWAVSDSPEENRRRHQAGAPDPSGDLWALIPVYGSIQQIREADSYFQRVLGVGFLMLDFATLGTAGIAAKALIRAPAALIRTAVARRGGALVVREGGEIASEAAARETAAAFTRQGGQLVASQAEATQQMFAALQRGALVVVTEGGLNHSAIFARNAAGQVMKVHGGPLRLLFQTGAREMSEGTAASIARRANAYAVVEAGETAVSIEHAIAQVQRGGPAALRWLGGNPTSCGLVQGALLEASGLPSATLARLVPQGAASRLLPITMMDHQMAGGALRLVEGGMGRIVGGTLTQGGLLTVAAAVGPVSSSLLRIVVTEGAGSGSTSSGDGGSSSSGHGEGAPPNGASPAMRTAQSDDAAFRIVNRYGVFLDGHVDAIRADLTTTDLFPGWLVMSDQGRQSLAPSLVSAGVARSTAEAIVR